MMQLPDAFVAQMRNMLGDETDEFLRSYNLPRTQGLRLNTLKISRETPVGDKLADLFGLSPVAWCPTGFYYKPDARPGKHPYHAAGLYYIQEPSAMLPVELLDPKPGERVLDVAAAPGGKSTQIAGKLRHEGLLIASEIHPARAKILSENLERMGVPNALAVNASPRQLAAKFSNYFDKIMLDAPCSGEGMFRKDPEAVAEWSPAHVDMCAVRQMDILEQAAPMLKPGGTLVYSTCTFNTAENERTIEAFIGKFPEFEVERTERIWPHRAQGEGHFAAVLRKAGERGVDHTQQTPAPRSERAGKKTPAAKYDREALARFEQFAREHLTGFDWGPGRPFLFGEQLYLLPDALSGDADRLRGIKLFRPGLHLGAVRKDRFEPSHALALHLRAEQSNRRLELPAEHPDVAAYLRGDTLRVADALRGWTLVTIDGYPLGWVKCSGGAAKNHYPKGLRWPG